MASFDKLKDGYRQKWDSMEIKPSVLPAIDGVARRIIANKARYQAVEKATGVPWKFVAVVHYRESNLNFGCNIHNGEALNRVTRLVPRGRGPFDTFEESCDDSFAMQGFLKEKEWSLEKQAFHLEAYNGFGYQGRKGGNPYLWGGTNHYAIGKYVRDGVYSGSFYDPQVGVMPILKRIDDLDLTAKDLRKESTTLTVFSQARAGVAATGAAIAGLFSLDTLQIWKDVWSTVNEFGKDHWVVLLALSLTVTFGILKWAENRRKKEYDKGAYTPSGMEVKSDVAS